MRHPPQDQTIPEQERASTGIPGLDHILGGGLPGVGKTTTASACVSDSGLSAA